MSDRNEMPDAVLLAGPTASGKSALALDMAERLGGTVVNADSMQVYSILRVITARPSPEDEERVPHRLYGHVDPREPMSAAAYLADVRKALTELRKIGSLPIITGGTGLYLRALEEGLAPVPEIDPGIRQGVRSLDVAGLREALLQEDAAIAEILRPTDTQRQARALEVVRSTGRSLHAWQKVTEPGPLAGLNLRRIVLLPERSLLHDRIARRVERIVRSQRARDEVKALSAIDPSNVTQAARAIGVSQIGAICDGTMDEVEASRSLTVATRRYAKRQYTWFNNGLRGDWERWRPSSEDRVTFE